MKNSRRGTFVVAILFLLNAMSAQAVENWRTRAHVDIETPGLIEATVPPGLVSRTENSRMDILLTGPDHHPRAFELYWRDPVGDVDILLQPDRVRMDRRNDVIWEAPLPEKIVARRLQISLAEKGAIGKIDVEGQVNGTWISLARNAAVFATAGPLRAGIDIPENTYTRLRLILTGYDRRIRKTLPAIRSVTVEGRRTGKDFETRKLSLPFRQSTSKGVRVIEAVLPGDGLWIDTLDLVTEAQFQGSWQAGREQISDGSRHFEPLLRGNVSYLDHHPRELAINAHRPWPGRVLELRLDAGERYVGNVVTLTATVHLPRIVFVAEKTGRYMALSGTGNRVRVLTHPGDKYREAEASVVFSTPETNPHWRLASLVEKYRFKGAPFSSEGYTWQAPVAIAASGYYRLALNLQAGLAPHHTAIRIVKDGNQVPYIAGRPEDRTIALKSEASYDKRKNSSTWIIHLPHVGPGWETLTLSASDIFKRTLVLQTPKAGIKGWQLWKRVVWESREKGGSVLRVSLRDLPGDTETMRLLMAHGDNQPVSISGISACYATPTVYFLAYAPGVYTVFGGNPGASVPRYDLSLVQPELLSTLPVEAHMGEIKILAPSSWFERIRAAFRGQGWGLYAVLGLVTIVLIVLIIRLFPKPPDHDPA